MSLRASSAVDCARKAVYEHRGAPAREFTDRERRILFRGKQMGKDYALMMAAKYGADDVQAERKVPWPDPEGPWVGHMDVYIMSQHLPIEVLSSQAGMAQIERKMLQVALYTVFDADAGDRARVVLLNPVDYSEDRLDFTVDAEWRARVATVVSSVQEALAAGSLPERVCRKPSDAIGHFCRVADTCFEGWEPPEPAHIVSDPDVRRLAAALWSAKETERIARKELETIKGNREQVQADLAALLEPGEYVVGPLKVKRTHIETAPRPNAAKIRAAKFPLPDEFWKPGAVYDKWTLERDGDGPLVDADDFGEEVPF